MSGRLNWPVVPCAEPECANTVYNKTTNLCRNHYARRKARERLNELKVRPCAGECGKRIHNIKYLVVPGIAQGHGVGQALCSGCSLKIKLPPRVDRVVKNRGLCSACKHPMQSGKPDEGFKKHKAKGLCIGCYTRHNYKVRRGINAGELNRAAKLQEGDVLEIRRLYKTGTRQPELAEMYGVSHQNIHSIVTRKSWRHLYESVDTN